VLCFIFDRDLEESTVLVHPIVYRDNNFLTKKTVGFWYLRALYQAVILAWLSFRDPLEANDGDGSWASLDETRQVTYSALIIIVSMSVAFTTQTFTAINVICLWGNWLLYLVGAMVAECSYRDLYMVIWRVLAAPMNWVVMMTMVSAAILPPICIQTIMQLTKPTRAEELKIREVQIESQFLPLYLTDADENARRQVDGTAEGTLFTEHVEPRCCRCPRRRSVT
jgi:magnesium-transporting ATPase (P-type)